MMSDEERERDEEEEEDALEARFPPAPRAPEVPEVPHFAPRLPEHPSKPRPGAVEPGSYNKLALATTAASSFIMPIIILSVGGYYLDRALRHETYWIAFIGVLVGLVVGTISLINIMNRLSQ
ncbi:MAG TPA: AtpZ/AtpI family protein [Chthonomonadaceae bacterium]|nr:AtpZ/AtpI family protein [Chthonomonadaceae bacterium]